MNRDEMIGRWLEGCELLIGILKIRANSRNETDQIIQQLNRFIMTGLLPWETICQQ